MLDTLARQIQYCPLDLIVGTDSAVITLTIQSVSGGILTAESGSGSTIKARLHGTSDPFVDINASPISLGSTGAVAYDFKVSPKSITGRIREVLSIVVTQTVTAANWKS